MALALNQIGSFTFLTMTPAPPIRKRRTFTETRSGVDGHAIWFDGERGEEWNPRTVVDVGSFIVAQGIKSQYEQAVGSIASIVYQDLVYPDALIQDVRVRLRSQLFGIGGTSSAPQALITADWTLLIL